MGLRPAQGTHGLSLALPTAGATAVSASAVAANGEGGDEEETKGRRERCCTIIAPFSDRKTF